jgi:hypothetical protein
LIGWHLAAGVLGAAEAKDFIATVLADTDDATRTPMERCFAGFLGRLDPEIRVEVLAQAIWHHLKGEVSADEVGRLLLAAPFRSETWIFVDRLPTAEQRRYWENVAPGRFFGESVEDSNRVVQELLSVDRPRAAFNVIEMEFAKIESSRLVRLLFEAATNRSEPDGHYQLAGHDISDAFKELTKRQDVMKDELARLEFLYIDALDHTEHGIRNLEAQIGQSPELFMQVVALAFRRKDGKEDPPELRPSNQDNASALAPRAYSLLSHARRTPGTNDRGELDVAKLREWLSKVRELARECSREVVTDQLVGQILGRSQKGEDGKWPNEAIREVLEDLGTPELANGMSIGLYNARGAHYRGEGGSEEQALANMYRGWSKEFATKYPFTSRMLRGIAESYEREAEWHDTDSQVRRRLQH